MNSALRQGFRQGRKRLYAAPAAGGPLARRGPLSRFAGLARGPSRAGAAWQRL